MEPEKNKIKLLNTRQVCALLSISRTTLWRYSKDGTFPSPIILTKQRIAWREDQLNDWIKSRPSPYGIVEVKNV